MPSIITDPASYWDHYSAGVAAETCEHALKTAFGWTQWDDHGPGDELLGEPVNALELGSGRGNAVAALATKGIETHGIDLSAAGQALATQRWGDIPGARFHTADALDYLTDHDQRWEAIYSIWGALWFTDPTQLLPLIRDRLAPGGKLVFSHAPAVPDSYGKQGIYGNGFTGRQTWLYRWAYEPDTWTELLEQHGFTHIKSRIHPAPNPADVGTLLVEAQRPQDGRIT